MITFIDEKAMARMRVISAETGRSIEDLATTAVEEAALNYFRHRSDDPGDKVEPSAPRTR